MGASVGVIAREEMDRPMDASDITSVEKGQEEVQRIRRLVTELYSSESKVLAADSSTASLSHLQIGVNGDLAPAGYDSPRQGAGKGGGGGGGGGGARPGGSGALRRRSTSFDRRRRRSLGGPGSAAPLSPADVLARRAQGADLAAAYVEWAAAAVAAEEQGGGGAASPQPPPLDTAAALDCLRLLPAEAALRARRLLPYAEAHAAGLLVPGSAVLGGGGGGGGGGGPRVLFVSHRWYRAEDPDPDGRAFAVLSAFLRNRGRRVTHVWLACSCADPARSVAHARRLAAAARRRSSLSPRPPTGGDLAAGPGAAAEAAASAISSPHRGSFGSLDSGSPPKSSRASGGGDGGPAEGAHLLALLAATDLLLLPAVRRHSGGGGGRGGGWASDLGDFLSRGTLRAEAALGLLAGADATLALHWSPSPEEETKDGGGGGDAGPLAAGGGGGGTFWARCDWGAEGRKTYVLAAGRAARALADDDLPDAVADGWLGAAAAAGGGPAALAAPFAAALDAVQADPLLRRRLRSGRAHEGDLASRPAVAQAAARAGEFASEADRLQCARTALQALLFLATAARPAGADRLGLREEKRPDQNLNIIGEDDEEAITRK